MTAPATFSLSPEITAFVEEFGLLISEAGLPRSVGRVLGFLMICLPEQQTAEDLQGRLQLSAGTVSTALTLLQKMGLVQRVSVAGERKLYYRQDPACWQKLLETRLRQMNQGARLAEKGLAIRASDDRLMAMRDLYAKLVLAFSDV
jgi:DNA-binding transcriptional regulator GbsR (MarR family)